MNEMQPQEPNRAEQELVPWTPLDLLKAIGLVIGTTIILVGILIVFLILFIPDTDFEKYLWLILTLASIPMYGSMAFSIWLLAVHKYRIPWRFLGLRRFKPVRGALLALGVVAAGIVVGILYDLLRKALGFDPVPTLPPEFTATPLNWAALAFLAVGIAPLAEELFFRGFIFPGLSKRLGYGWGIVISAMLFAIAHLNPASLAPIFILGILLAWLYKKTGSIWPCVLAHCTYNSIALILAALV